MGDERRSAPQISLGRIDHGQHDYDNTNDNNHQSVA